MPGAIVHSVTSSQQDALFATFKDGVDAELRRLDELMKQCLESYKIMNSRWMLMLDQVPSEGAGFRQPVAQFFDVDERLATRSSVVYMDQLFSDAEQVEGPLFEQMETLVRTFNAAAWPKELGLDKQVWPFRLHRRQLQKGKSEPCSWFRKGPRKTRERAEQKVANDYSNCEWPPAAHLLDIVRCPL
jgi:hypothetical protein